MSGSVSTGDLQFNSSLSCAARSIQRPVDLPFPTLLPFLARCFLIIFYMSMVIFGAFLNIFVIYLVCKFKTLRTTEFAFAIQNATVGALSSILLVPASLVSALANEWLFGEQLCTVFAGLVNSITYLRAGLMFTFVIDRVLNVFAPYAYPRHRRKTVAAFLVAFYAVSFVCFTLIMVLGCASFSVTSWICRPNRRCSSQCGSIQYWLFLMVFAPSATVPFLLYMVLFCKAKLAASQPVGNVPVQAEENRASRVTTTFFLMFLSLFVVSFTPIVLLLVAHMREPTSTSDTSPQFYVLECLAFNIIYLANLVDPLFILRNRDVREALPKLTWLPSFWYCSY